MRLALFATTILALMLLASDTALACNCLPMSTAENLNRADVVFEGELIRTTPLPQTSSFTMAYTFKVNKAMKGTSAGEVVSIFGQGSECEARFDSGFIYRVYATDLDGTLRTWMCSGNEIVGAAVPRAFAWAHPRFPWQRFVMNTLAVCALGVLLGSGAFVWRKCGAKLP